MEDAPQPVETQPITLKPSWQTSEFWVSMVPAFTAMATAFGIITADEVNSVQETLKVLILGVFSAILIIGQVWSRGKVKEAAIRANAQVMSIGEAPKKDSMKATV